MSVFVGVKDPVFVGVEDPTSGLTKVHNARDYQTDAFHSFVSNPNILEILFHYPGNIIFTVKRFDKSGLKGDYPRFCVLENERREQHILSDNESLLRGFSGWKNRMSNPLPYKPYGGSKKKSTKRKPVIKKKSTKRKPIIKKKSTKK